MTLNIGPFPTQWASEIGILNKSWPILITTLQRVPPGTNGGISELGMLASFAGGAAMGLAAALTLALEQSCHGFAYEIVLLGAAAGLVGSLVRCHNRATHHFCCAQPLYQMY